MAEYVFTYGKYGKDNGDQDHNGGYTMVHCPDFETAFNLFMAAHPRRVPHLPSFASVYTENDLKRRGITAEHFGKCHDHIVYAVLFGGAD